MTPLTKVVFPEPRSPNKATTELRRMRFPNSAPSAGVSSALVERSDSFDFFIAFFFRGLSFFFNRNFFFLFKPLLNVGGKFFMFREGFDERGDHPLFKVFLDKFEESVEFAPYIEQ